ncbi:MAG TPA: hypothetical protein VG204_23180 [Terriglobia bacterium]|nr:hypothetical protein [Terriglobia bacterium]
MSPERGKTKAERKKKPPKRKKKLVDLKDILLCNCVAGPNTRELSKKKRDQALWKSGDGQGYTITFDVSPFKKGPQFTVKPNGTTASGPIRDDASYDDYEYTVDGDNGCHQDPVIHIGP